MPYRTSAAVARPTYDLSLATTPAARSAARGTTGPRLSAQAISFLLVGGVATAVDVGLFNVLHYQFGSGPVTAKVLSTIAGGVVAFLGNRQFSFGDQTGSAVRRQVVAFALVSLVALGLSVLPLVIARYGLGLTGVVALNAAGNVIGLALATLFRFWACQRWVFTTPAGTTVAPVAEPVDARLAA